MRAHLRFLLAVLTSTFALAPVTGGCGSDEASESDDLTQSVSFKPLEVSREGAKAGLTIIKNGSDYRAFFGDDAPVVDFNKHWVVHYSMGAQSSGGYATRITAIMKTGPSNNRQLVVYTTNEKPGADCANAAVITHPQVAVLINKQPSTPKKKSVVESVVKNCGAIDCGDLEDVAVDACFSDGDDPDWESCFKDGLDGLGDVRQPAKDCCNDGGPFFWCADYNNGGFTCAPAGGTCADEHVGCDFGQDWSEDEDLTCPQVDSHSAQYCCVDS